MEKSAENWALDVLQRTAAYTHPQDVAQSPAASTNNSSNSLIQASSRDDGVSGSASIMDSGNFGLPPVIEPTGQWQHDINTSWLLVPLMFIKLPEMLSISALVTILSRRAGVQNAQ